MTLSSTTGIGQLEAVTRKKERGKKEKDEKEREGEREGGVGGRGGRGGGRERERVAHVNCKHFHAYSVHVCMYL